MTEMREAKKFDVLIVGAGPAGSFAAEKLARSGKSVVLFDGRPAGEPKACGGGVTAKALKAWPHLLEAVGRTVNELEMYSPSGRRLHMELDEPFAIYSRLAFDNYLRERARAAGAEVVAEKIGLRTITRIVQTAGGTPAVPVAEKIGLAKIAPTAGATPTVPVTDSGWVVRGAHGAEWQGTILVGADGANSAIAKKLAGPLQASDMEVAFGYRAPLPEQSEAPTVIAFLPGWVGYAWAFPRIDHISFGIATTQDSFDHKSLDELLWLFMVSYYGDKEENSNIWQRSDDRETADRENKLRATAERYAARIPGLADKTWDTRRACGDGWALLGDAAGFADPVTGEGIYYALRSAELFAQAVVEGVPGAYEQRWREDFGGELRRASQMRRRFYGNFWGAPFTERMIEFARGHKGIKKVLGDLVAGEQGYVGLKKKLARSALRPL
jgi:geranylgeranyl reductase family protein